MTHSFPCCPGVMRGNCLVTESWLCRVYLFESVDTWSYCLMNASETWLSMCLSLNFFLLTVHNVHFKRQVANIELVSSGVSSDFPHLRLWNSRNRHHFSLIPSFLPWRQLPLPATTLKLVLSYTAFPFAWWSASLIVILFGALVLVIQASELGHPMWRTLTWVV